MQSVADAAGVAVSTVSRVLNGGSASARARQKVEEAIARLGYAPSATARNLKLGRSGIIGMAGASSTAPWFTALLGGMERVLSRHGASLAIASLVREDEYDSSAVQAWIQARRVDALALVRPGKRERPLVNAARRAALPVAFVVPDLEVDWGLVVKANNLQGGRLAAEHLLDLGHREIAFFGGPADSVDTRERLAGLRAGLRAAGVRLPDSRVRFGRDYATEQGAEAAKLWASRPALRRATAVVLGNDAMALGFLREVRSQGLSVPEDVSVVGFDGIVEGALSVPSLTTVAQPIPTMGADVATFLLDGSLQISAPAVHREYDLELLCRESTQPPRSRP